MNQPGHTPSVVLLTRYLATAAQPDSGIGRHFLVLADALAEAGVQVRIILLAEDAVAQRAAIAALNPRWSYTVMDCNPPSWMTPAPRRWTLYWLIRDLWASILAARELLRLRIKETNTVVETHSTAFPALLAAGLGLPVLVRVSTTMAQLNRERGIYSRWLDAAAILERMHLTFTPALLTHSARHRANVCADTAINPLRFALVPHGLPSPVITTATDDRKTDELRLLFVGRFERRKGIDTLVAALPGLLTRHPTLQVSLVGDSTKDPRRTPPLSDLPVELLGRVHVHGRLDENALAALWAKTTVLVAPSRYESFGLVYVEAMSRGIVPVGCAVGGVPDVITSGKDGLLVPAGDPQALAGAIDSLLGDPKMRARLGANALATYHARFSTSALARASLALYQRLADHHRPPALL